VVDLFVSIRIFIAPLETSNMASNPHYGITGIYVSFYVLSHGSFIFLEIERMGMKVSWETLGSGNTQYICYLATVDNAAVFFLYETSKKVYLLKTNFKF
jgi:hypothetical protein